MSTMKTRHIRVERMAIMATDTECGYCDNWHSDGRLDVCDAFHRVLKKRGDRRVRCDACLYAEKEANR